MRGMLEAIAGAIGASPELLWIPADVLEAQGVGAWMDMPVWVPGEGDSAGFARRSIDRALAAGLTFRPLATTARDTLEWFRAQPAERQATLRAGLSADREAALLEARRKASGG